MKGFLKRILSVLTAIAMVYTVFATPLGEILGFVGESTTAEAAAFSGTMTYDEVKAKIDALANGTYNTSDSNYKKFVVGNYFNSKTTTPCKHGSDICYCISGKVCIKNLLEQKNYDKSGSQCMGFAYAVYNILYGSQKFPDNSTSNSRITVNLHKYSGSAAAVTNGLEEIKKLAAPGDYLRVGDGTTGHSMIIYDLTDTGVKVYNANKNGDCLVYFTTFSWDYLLTRAKKGYYIGLWKPTCVVNSLNLTSTPNNLGSQFVSPIKVTSTGKVLTAGSDGNVTVQNWTGADNQRWLFTKNTSDNYYEIRNGQYVLKVLDVNNGGNTNDTNIQIWEDNDTASQRFGIYGSQGSYVIKPKYSTTHVVDSGGGNNNVHLWQYYSPTIDAQKFTISPEPSTRFDTFSVSNITKNDARVKCMAYKRSEDKAVKYGVVYAPADTWDSTSTRKTFYSVASTNNVGKTSREIYFDFGPKEIGDTLKADTTYKYYFVAIYNMDGVEKTFSSSVQSFKTSNSCSTHSYGSWTTKTAATCTADGLKSRTCSACGKVESATIAKTGHSYTSSVTKAATCTATGVKTYKCSKCSNSYTETIAKTAHNYSTSWTVDKAATCTTAGSKSKHCTTSGCTAKADVTTIPATNHSYTSSVTKAATCTATGVKTYKCSKCSDSYTETIAKTAHNYSTSWTVDKAATCTTAGSKSHHCTASGCTAKADVTAIAAKGHTYGNWTTTKSATCTESGSKTRKCTACSHSETQTIAAQGHNFATEWTIDKAATCTLTGSKSYHCTRCSATKQNTTIAANGHSFGAWVVTKEATHTAEGISERVCAKCNTTESQKIAKLSLDGHTHQFGEWKTVEEATCLNDGKESRTCTLCSQTESKVLSALGHEYGEWTETPATCTKEGQQSRKCAVCNDEETIIIEVLGHNFEQFVTVIEPTENGTGLKEGECKTCGEHIEEVIPSIAPNTTTATTDETPTPEETTSTDETSSDIPADEEDNSQVEEETSSNTSNVEETDKQQMSTEWLAWTLLGVVAVGFVVTLIIVLPKKKKD